MYDGCFLQAALRTNSCYIGVSRTVWNWNTDSQTTCGDGEEMECSDFQAEILGIVSQRRLVDFLIRSDRLMGGISRRIHYPVPINRDSS